MVILLKLGLAPVLSLATNTKMPLEALGLTLSRNRKIEIESVFSGSYLWKSISGELTPTDLTSGASSGQGFTIVNSTEITPTTVAISDDPNWELDGNGDLTPTT